VAKRLADEPTASHFKRQFRNLQTIVLEDTGHMLHHERPERIAALVEQFFR
jgi:pimeloyl-ACP methyl ester carboxylesterase